MNVTIAGTANFGAGTIPKRVRLFLSPHLHRFVKFCLVGCTGTLVDMATLFVLADPNRLGWNIAWSKLCAAEIALVNNFVWNEFWTFRSPSHARSDGVKGFQFDSTRLHRFLRFNAICGIGILFAIALLELFHTRFGWNLYLSNLLTIGLVTLWNFGLNARFNWRAGGANDVRLSGSKRLAVFVLTLIAIPQVHGAGFAVTGRSSCLKPEGDVLKATWVCPFEVSVLGNQWKVTLFLTNGQTVLHGCDGNSVYALLVDPRAAKQSHILVGNVFRGIYPADGTIQTVMPWLAYCSQDFLARAKTADEGDLTIPAPWMPAWAIPQAHIYKARCTPVEGSGGLPGFLTFEPDQRAISRLRNGQYGTVATVSDSERDRALIDLGYYSRITEPEAAYRVTRLTNCNGVAIPADSFLELYRFEFAKSETKRKLSFRINCELESVRVIDSIAALPAHEGPIQNISVADYRFFEPSNGVSFLRYTVTNSGWITNESDPFLQRLLSHAVSTGLTRNSGKLPKLLLAVVLMTLVLFPLLIKQLRQRLWDTAKSICAG